jgi:TolA-binding protein
MARALALAGDAARMAGDKPAAADLFLRAGRSAAAQNDPETAKAWLQQAIDLSQDSAVADAAQAALETLTEP